MNLLFIIANFLLHERLTEESFENRDFDRSSLSEFALKVPVLRIGRANLCLCTQPASNMNIAG